MYPDRIQVPSTVASGDLLRPTPGLVSISTQSTHLPLPDTSCYALPAVPESPFRQLASPAIPVSIRYSRYAEHLAFPRKGLSRTEHLLQTNPREGVEEWGMAEAHMGALASMSGTMKKRAMLPRM
jgi:hypothetical protein